MIQPQSDATPNQPGGQPATTSNPQEIETAQMASIIAKEMRDHVTYARKWFKDNFGREAGDLEAPTYHRWLLEWAERLDPKEGR